MCKYILHMYYVFYLISDECICVRMNSVRMNVYPPCKCLLNVHDVYTYDVNRGINISYTHVPCVHEFHFIYVPQRMY